MKHLCPAHRGFTSNERHLSMDLEHAVLSGTEVSAGIHEQRKEAEARHCR